MEILRGAARDLTAAEAVQLGSIARVAGTQGTCFGIQRRTVRMMMTPPLFYDEGDQIIVAGTTLKDGIFNGFAAMNITTGQQALKRPVITMVVSAIVFVICIPFCLITVGFPVCLGAATFFLLALRSSRAAKLVLQQASAAVNAT